MRLASRETTVSLSLSLLLFFLKKCFFADTYTYPILGPLVPVFFWISGDVSSVFQSQSGFCLIRFCKGECNVHSLSSASGAAPANLLTASGLVINFTYHTDYTCFNFDLVIFFNVNYLSFF